MTAVCFVLKTVLEVGDNCLFCDLDCVVNG